MTKEIKRILICGGREWNDIKAIRTYLETYKGKDVTIIEGGCRGADAIAAQEAKKLGLVVEEYKADWMKYGKSAGFKRNTQMLVEGKPDLVVAFHQDINSSKGTKMMLRIAHEAGVETILDSGDKETKISDEVLKTIDMVICNTRKTNE